MAELYCYYNPEYKISPHERIASTVPDVLRLLKNQGVKSCVIKTTEGSHGEGVEVINKIEYYDDDCILWKHDHSKVFLSACLGKEPLVIESVIKQTNQFRTFNESSVNCIRFMTALWPNGEARIVAAFIKIGRKGKCVDNAGQGGNIDAKVDVATGRLCNAYQFESFTKVKPIEFHPDSGNRIDGVVIEDWKAIKDKVISYQQAMPFCKAAGWDIAITDNGPIIVEVNDYWDRTGQLFIGKGWRHEIRECYEAWREYYNSNNEQQ